MTYTAQSCREEAAINDKFGDPIMNDPDLLRAHADALEEKARLRADNDTLRGLLGNSALPCPYCGLAAEDQSKCAHGFPGCARADDQMLSKHFADGYRAERAEAELAETRRDLQFIERWANHHGQKPNITPREVLSMIQHYPPILEITRSYEDGKVPDTPNPWAELAKLRAEANDDDALRERMADILTRTAAALKGEPEPLTLHDWSGLPEIAELALTAERERADRNQEDAERYQWLRMNRLWLKANLPMIHAGAFDAAIDAARRK